MADVAHLYRPVRRTPGRKSMGAGGLTACPWLENDESARLGVRRSSRHFHLLQVLAFGYFSPHHKPIGHEGALRVPWRDSQRPVSYPVGLQRTPVTRWVVGRLHRVTRNRLSPLCSYSSASKRLYVCQRVASVSERLAARWIRVCNRSRRALAAQRVCARCLAPSVGASHSGWPRAAAWSLARGLTSASAVLWPTCGQAGAQRVARRGGDGHAWGERPSGRAAGGRMRSVEKA